MFSLIIDVYVYQLWVSPVTYFLIIQNEIILFKFIYHRVDEMNYDT